VKLALQSLTIAMRVVLISENLHSVADGRDIRYVGCFEVKILVSAMEWSSDQLKHVIYPEARKC
jgi:hypothetical protein